MNQIQVIQMVLSNGQIVRFTGEVQIKPGENPKVDHLMIFEIEKPQQTLVDCIMTTENVLKTISEDRLNDTQRKHMLNNHLEKLQLTIKRANP